MQDTSERREKGTELFEVHQSLQRERVRNYELIQRLAKVSHKLKNTNYPTPENEAKQIGKEPETGIVFDISKEAECLTSQNNTLQDLVNKFESII